MGQKSSPSATATDVSSTTTTSDIGAYSLPQLAVGNLRSTHQRPKFKEFIADGVEVHVSTNTSVNASLQLGTVSEKVTVQADAVQVETTSAAVGEVVVGTQVRELPLSGENFVGLTQLSPGVNAAQGANFVGKGLDGGVNFSVNGNPYTNNLFLVDGVNNNDVGSNRTILVYPSVDTIAEFKMIRNSYGPEYGQASGAIISITTKSGENKFHGGVFYSGRNDALDANNWFANHDNLGKAKERRRRLRLQHQRPGDQEQGLLLVEPGVEQGNTGCTFGRLRADGCGRGRRFQRLRSGTTDQCGATHSHHTRLRGRQRAIR